MAFTQKDINEIVNRYEITDMSLVPSPSELILKVDNSEQYEGDYGELFVKNGVLYETGCSHCSCYGCEGQWKPEVTFLNAIKRRPGGFMGVSIKLVSRKARAAGYTGE
jgi:hypothetical protein